MALKKGDRAQAPTRDGIAFGFISKAGSKIEMVLDNGRQQISGSPSIFTPSTHPVPKDSPFANPIVKPGSRVSFTVRGEHTEGVVVKGDIFTATVRTGLYEYKVPQSGLSHSTIEVPVDPPGPMDAWSVRKYRPIEALSTDSVAYTAEILLNGKKALDVKNDGNGGCDIYYGNWEVQKKLDADATAWAKSFGDDKAREAADTWLTWACENKPLGLTATEFFAERKARVAAMLGEDSQADDAATPKM